jgi:hypothetical protein
MLRRSDCFNEAYGWAPSFFERGGSGICTQAGQIGTFIRSWHTTCDEKTYAGGAQIGFVALWSSKTRGDNAVIVLETNDLRRPIVKLRMPSIVHGEDAHARLNILING